MGNPFVLHRLCTFLQLRVLRRAQGNPGVAREALLTLPTAKSGYGKLHFMDSASGCSVDPWCEASWIGALVRKHGSKRAKKVAANLLERLCVPDGSIGAVTVLSNCYDIRENGPVSASHTMVETVKRMLLEMEIDAEFKWCLESSRDLELSDSILAALESGPINAPIATEMMPRRLACSVDASLARVTDSERVLSVFTTAQRGEILRAFNSQRRRVRDHRNALSVGAITPEAADEMAENIITQGDCAMMSRLRAHWYACRPYKIDLFDHTGYAVQEVLVPVMPDVHIANESY